MNSLIKDIGLIRKYEGTMGGVYTLPDLAILMDESHKTVLYRRIRRLQEGNVIKRFSRGIYITEKFSPSVLSQKIRADSCISFGNVLAETRVIGSVPKFQIDAISTGKSIVLSHEGITIRYFGVAEHLLFGFEYRNGVRMALPEKAFLDTLYFYQHGARFFFDIFSDVNTSALDQTRLNVFLQKYRNPRFQAFVKGYLDGDKRLAIGH